MISSSFSHKIGQGINGGNGYGIVEAETERDDNSWDSNSNIIYKLATSFNETYGKSYNLHCDLGKSTSDPLSILGAGREIKKKNDGDIGIKIMGAISSLCRYNPNKFYAFCKVANGPINIMTYNFGDHVQKIKQIMESGSRDYRDVDRWFEENRIIKVTESFRNDIFDHPVIQEVYNTIGNDEMKEALQFITSGQMDHFTIFIGEYNTPLPDDIPEGIYKTLNLSKMLYYKQLIAGKKIIYLNPENTLTTLTGEDAISPLGNPSQFARVLCKVDVYELQDGICFRVALHTEDTNGISTDSKVFHITDSQNIICNKSYKVKPIPDINIPSNAIHKGNLTMSISCISQTEQDIQAEALADGELGKRDLLRGLYCDYNRILGAPYWSSGKDTWGEKRNAGGIRAVLSFNTQWIAENIVTILCEKQRTNLTNAHPVLKKLFDMVIKTIIKNYSDYTNKLTSIPGVKEWNLNKLYYQITGLPLPQPPLSVPPLPLTPRPRPRVAPASESESISDTSSVSSTTSTSDEEIPTRHITFELCLREVIVMNAGHEITRINNNGNGSGIRDWLIGTYDKLNDDSKFIKWISIFGEINKQNNV
jgi:hypothetical protein